MPVKHSVRRSPRKAARVFGRRSSQNSADKALRPTLVARRICHGAAGARQERPKYICDQPHAQLHPKPPSGCCVLTHSRASRIGERRPARANAYPLTIASWPNNMQSLPRACRAIPHYPEMRSAINLVPLRCRSWAALKRIVPALNLSCLQIFAHYGPNCCAANWTGHPEQSKSKTSIVR